ncbi:pilus (MSHA type) biogenesis protein MshL [Desulfoprunum benzoelyticum]|uniref:General secretion pathway protein D/MSHA biogenesis protein MshL n=1 Tax=Desulfoprunum benzoelyticum TaxID=1506996 RepID=A0A840UNR1_9BACT|nr:pilus (MSHA type) biogenesis protein MshL [Desulfoprunum benzoelyticum]MBB5347897.1 general secretion pathway protein D/MSHA biogenesis protein MshL [Desulfoprunum benzoelyticum]MBM9530346.1 pilus (MSHA type) biogenesis protein MshL [Desulfoprunum benzoelyticum]
MKSQKNMFFVASLLLFLMLTSCSAPNKASDKSAAAPAAPTEQNVAARPATPNTLPVQYQTPSYQVGEESREELSRSEDVGMKVGATIKSTRGPQPLWDIMKRLAAIKGMNISWASDVDQKVLVDVDINANDDYNESIANLLRQVDYFHQIEGNTIVVKYKETRQFYIAMPFIKQSYSTGIGGNSLGGGDSQEGSKSTSVEGTIAIQSKDNVFNVWESIEANLNSILEVWTTEAVTEINTTTSKDSKTTYNDNKALDIAEKQTAATRRLSGNQNVFMIDKPVGMITVTAPRPLLDRVDAYIKNLKKELYKQISIEAKIIEVKLTQESSIGINWTQVLQNFKISGAVEFGSKALGGQVYPYIFANEDGTDGNWDDGTNHGKIQDPTRFVSKVSINTANFDVFLNALETQGDTKVLSNPKISVMNGQPALISVGRNTTYIKALTKTITKGSAGTENDTEYTPEIASILSGVGMSLTATILDDNQIILNLVPVTTELENGEVAYRRFPDGSEAGIPVVEIREMSTTVKVKNGEMLVIGGLISDVEGNTGNFAPVVGKIPLIKYLFGHEEKSNRKRELIILLKPNII